MLPSDVLKECKLFLTSYKKFLQDMLRVKSDADLTMISLKAYRVILYKNGLGEAQNGCV